MLNENIVNQIVCRHIMYLQNEVMEYGGDADDLEKIGQLIDENIITGINNPNCWDYLIGNVFLFDNVSLDEFVIQVDTFVVECNITGDYCNNNGECSFCKIAHEYQLEFNLNRSILNEDKVFEFEKKDKKKKIVGKTNKEHTLMKMKSLREILSCPAMNKWCFGLIKLDNINDDFLINKYPMLIIWGIKHKTGKPDYYLYKEDHPLIAHYKNDAEEFFLLVAPHVTMENEPEEPENFEKEEVEEYISPEEVEAKT